MTSAFGPGGFEPSPFDEFLARFLGGGRPVQRIDITKLMSQQAQQLVADAARRAAEYGHTDLDAIHLVWAATAADPTREMLRQSGADPDALAQSIEQQIPRGEPTQEAPSLTPAAKRALLDAHQVSRAMGSSYIGPDHLLLALAANQDSNASRFLHSARVSPESLQQAAGTPSQQQGRGQGEQRATNTPTLDQYGQDLTERAGAGSLDPVVGRDDEIEQTIEVLSRRTKNNPVLIGEAGVGKTAIVEGIAQRVADGEVPDVLSAKRVVQLNLSAMVSGTRYRGDFEERMNKVIDEIAAHRDELIVFIDEIHTVVGAGGAEGAVDAGNMLKPRLSRGELHVVGATTLDEYRKNIEKDAALERRFQPVMVAEPSVADAISILCGLRDRYEAHHQVRFTDEAITAAVELSDRYIADRYLPDKAIDLLDQAGARKRLHGGTRSADVRELEQRVAQLSRDKDQAVASEQYEQASELRDQIAETQQRINGARGDGNTGSSVLEVTAQDIAEVVSRATGIPASQLTEAEKERLQRLEEELHQRVVGQDEAVHAIARAVRRNRTGMGDPNRPVGSFLFLGPTGVGKTELAKALASALFGDESHMQRLDMSEFGERHTASRLVGAPPGYVGHEEAGQLTEAVRRRPYTVILLDEIEKAHPDIFNILLQVLEDGRLTDGQGRTVDFKNTVLIMTSNLGSDLISSRSGTIGFAAQDQERSEADLRERLMGKLRENFRPEFLNRIDEVVIFQKLDAEQLHTITDLILEQSRSRLSEQGITVEFTSEAIDRIAEKGHQPEFGARPLRRTIQREVDDHIADLLLDDRVAAGQRVLVGAGDDGLTFDVSSPESTTHG